MKQVPIKDDDRAVLIEVGKPDVLRALRRAELRSFRGYDRRRIVTDDDFHSEEEGNGEG
jgi:hypothetical protein